MAEQNGINAALIEFQKSMPKVGRNTEGQAGQRKYKYADLTAITDAVVPLLTEHGLAFTCKPRRTEDGTYETVGTLLHVSGESLEGSLPIFGRSPQEIGSSLTYNRRYLLGNLTGIVTDEDDDAATAQRAPQQTRNQPSALDVAKDQVVNVWREVHNGEFDVMGMKADYQQRYGRDIDKANVGDLHLYIGDLRAPMTEDAVARSLGGTVIQEQEVPA